MEKSKVYFTNFRCKPGLNQLDKLRRLIEKAGMGEIDFTRKFSLGDQRDLEIKKILSAVYQALQEKGYDPINQIVGYILSEDPTYITNHNSARALIRKVDRDELLQTLVKYYLTH